MGQRTRTCALTLALTALLLALTAASATALPPRFWGVVPQAAPTPEQFQRLHRGGVRAVRLTFDWGSLQPRAGIPVDWSNVDGLVERAAASGVSVLPFLTGAPSWAVPNARVPGGGGTKAPAHLPVTGSAASGWRGFLQQAVHRYGPNGSFWVEHPGLPVVPIRTWQIWNEPNFKYFVTRPNPVEYGQLVKLSYTAVKSVDPGAKVILAGLFARPKGSRNQKTGKHKSLNWYARDFLAAMYKGNPGIRTKFDGVSLHPYTPRYQQLPEEVEEIRTLLRSEKDAAKGLWITELGWSSEPADPGEQFSKGVAGQARELRGAFTLLRDNQRKWKIQQIYWFSVDDMTGVCNFCSGSGLFGPGFKPKKSWFEYVKFAGGTP